MRITLRGLAVESDWRDEALRTNLWLIPAIESLAAVALFAVTLSIDEAVSHGALRLPSWVISGSPDAARQILSSLAGAIITVVGVVFSIVIVTLTLASQQFGPRMLRTFIRDRGAQVTLGTFVATSSTRCSLISIGSVRAHLSVTVALALTASTSACSSTSTTWPSSPQSSPASRTTWPGPSTRAPRGPASPARSRHRPRNGPSARSCWPGWTARAASWPAATCGSSGTRRWCGSPPSTTPSSGCTTGRGTSSPRAPRGDRLAARGGGRNRAPPGDGAPHRAAAHAEPGHRLRHRPARGDRDPRAVPRRQRHLHRPDLHRLAR